ncbi:uncharacterized protein A4U43_C09F1480 [Asparagus officinalis]|uniref:Uncharacterized protein n=1 Tax=Asparagus officinalis TaxID=4686 RepID=A0A5P1E4G3_ASPOF|nr:uncharacterized protein A4U43_C09F1480 [Asparagus officinalis]
MEPVLVRDSNIQALCDVGSPWRSQWKLFWRQGEGAEKGGRGWVQVERSEWGTCLNVLSGRGCEGRAEKDEGGGGTGNNKVKVFGGEGRVWFSGKRVKGKMAMWEEEGGEEEEEEGELGGKWRWVEGVPGYGEGVYRGFVYNAGLTEIP